MTEQRAVGQTKDVGFEIGVSRTVPHPIEQVWEFLVSERGTAVWLGPGARLGTERGTRYTTEDGTTGELRGFRPGDRVRLTCRPAGWTHDTTVQVVVAAAASPGRTRVTFHQEWLADAVERESQRAHWQSVLDRFSSELDEYG